MNIYTAKFDARVPSLQQVNVTTNTDYKIGVKVQSNRWITYEKDLYLSVELSSIEVPDHLPIDPEQAFLVGADGTVISADSKMTNDYVTFTLHSNDTEAYNEYTLSICNPTIPSTVVYTDEVKKFSSSRPKVSTLFVPLSCTDMAGTTLYPTDMFYTAYRYDKLSANVEHDTLIAYADENNTWKNSRNIYTLAGTPRPVPIYTAHANATTNIKEVYTYLLSVDTSTTPNKVMFDTSYCIKYKDITVPSKYVDKISIPDDALLFSYLQMSQSGTKYYNTAIKVVPFKAQFKLAVQVKESSVGEVAEYDVERVATDIMSNTTTLSGTYADDTEYSYNIITKKA